MKAAIWIKFLDLNEVREQKKKIVEQGSLMVNLENWECRNHSVLCEAVVNLQLCQDSTHSVWTTSAACSALQTQRTACRYWPGAARSGWLWWRTVLLTTLALSHGLKYINHTDFSFWVKVFPNFSLMLNPVKSLYNNISLSFLNSLNSNMF